MKLYKIRNPDCLYCYNFDKCNVINKYRDCFSFNPDLVLSRPLAEKIVSGNLDLYNDFIKFQSECEVIYHAD